MVAGMRTAYIGLGSNLDFEGRDRAQTLLAAIARLGRLGRVTARSSFYETEPVGLRDQPVFLNAAIALETALDPATLLREMLKLEGELGRDRSREVSKGRRVVDLDLLLFAGESISSPELTLPHPAMAERRFVLAPLAEIAPGARHPVFGKTMAELLARLPDEGENRVAAVRRLTEWPPDG